jgi:RHS repeat-associated protein
VDNFQHKRNNSTVGKRTTFFYDTASQGGGQYGNVTHRLYSIQNGANWLDQRIDWSPVVPRNTDTAYIVSLPAFVNQYECPSGSANGSCFAAGSGAPGGALRTSFWNLYDSSLTYSAAPTQGFLTGTRTYIGSDAGGSLYADVAYGYDGWGNQNRITTYASPGRETSFGLGTAQHTTLGYDTAFPARVVSHTNAAGHVTTVQYTNDGSICGLPGAETDPRGAVTTTEYDRLCRPIAIVRPGDSATFPTYQFSYTNTYPAMAAVTGRINAGDNANIIQERYFYNGLGLLIQQQVLGALVNGVRKDLVTDFDYDAHGRMEYQTLPYEATTNGAFKPLDFSRPKTTFRWDNLGRPLNKSFPDGTFERTEYDGWEVRLHDAKDNVTLHVFDGFGRMVEARPPQGPWTRYVYDVIDRLVQVEQRSGSAAPFATTFLTYDPGGRKTTMQDPDMGTWQYTYDGAGNLKTQADARGCVTSMSYDRLNRLTGKTFSGSCAGTAAVTYGYDAGTNGKGQRTSMTDASGSTTWGYDLRGRLVDEVKTVAGIGSFHTTWEYNSADLLKRMGYPHGNTGLTGEGVNYTYLNQLQIDTITGLASYQSGAQYDAAGRLVERKLGGTASAPTLLQKVTYYGWTTQGGRLKDLQAGLAASPSGLMNNRYVYDPVGNITSLTDATAPGGTQTHTYTYDALDRLESAAISGGTAGQLPTETYAYDAQNGNLEQRGEVLLSYDAQASDCGPGSRTHAVTRTLNDSQETRNCYDANGNQTRRVVAEKTNLLPNASFEAPGTWDELSTGYFPGTAFWRSIWSTAAPQRGSYAYAISNQAYGHLESSLFPVAGGTQYDLAAWVRGEMDPHDSAGAWLIRVVYYDANGAALSGADASKDVLYGHEGSLSISWQEKRGSFTTPAAARQARVRLYYYNATGWVAYDDIAVTQQSSGASVASYDFETAGGWTEARFYPGTAFWRANWSIAAGRNGGYAYSISNLPYGYLESAPVAVSQNTGYTVSAWARGEIDAEGSEGQWRVDLCYYNETTLLKCETSAGLHGVAGSISTTWAQKSGSFTTPAGATQTRLRLYLLVSSGWVAYDDVTITQANGTKLALADPGFEDGSGWTSVRAGSFPNTGFYRWKTSIASPHSGTWGYAISNLAYADLVSTRMTARAGETYALYGWLRGEQDADESAGGWVLRAYFYDVNNQYLGYKDAATGQAGSLAATWRKVGGVVTAPANSAHAEVRLIAYLFSGWVGVDNLTFFSKSDFTAAETTQYTYDGENRLVEVSGARSARYIYDGDGNLVVSIENGITTTLIGEHYEWRGAGASMTRYYYAGSTRLAMRVGAGTGTEGVQFLLGDHLGSTSVTTDGSGGSVVRQGYTPWGAVRYQVGGTLSTPYRFTGQRESSSTGLQWFRSRWYDPYLNRFLSPDSIVPDPYNSLDWDRYSYARNNPVNLVDPTGHEPGDICDRGYCNDKRDLTGWLAAVCVDAAESTEIKQIAGLNAAPGGIVRAGTGLIVTSKAALKVEAYKDFYGLVSNGKKFDVKLQIRETLGETIQLGNNWYEYSTAGNILYGFYGLAAGFSKTELSGGAGLAQLNDIFAKGNIPGGPGTFFDTEDDYYAVLFGYFLYENYYGDGVLTESEVVDALSQFKYADKLAKKPEPPNIQLTPKKYPANQFYSQPN